MIFPDQLAGMVRGDTINYETEHPGLGVSIAYDIPQLPINANIYIYDLTKPDIQNGSQSDLVKDNFYQSIADVYSLDLYGEYEAVEKLSENEVHLGDTEHKLKLLTASLTYIEHGVKRASHLYLTGYKGYFLKIRFTYDLEHETQGERFRLLFLDELTNFLP
jgi:hypothetical protein